MKHKMIIKKLHEATCERGCCDETNYHVACSCGLVFSKDASFNSKESYAKQHLEHRVDVLEKTIETLTRGK